ncbi:tyrosine-type recombinase/integrase [Methanococcoides alaskense]|uniref:Integrase n=1 Tax=Methanococcoides alaskense TaxID=325778 RepID=A0AA90TZ34_9EURY|nr:tyrosine-type recombinase/integrase [Methanococcoides alaskense]MDA0525662.1 tyrosine-type recombinase/integrase [Methanococcoides alaskense]MDR6222888.1 integrase [Methanococcoides alaskense]
MKREFKISENLKTLYNDMKVRLWLLNVAKSDATTKTHLGIMHSYVRFTEKSPTELIIEAGDEEKCVPMRDRSIKLHLLLFQEFLSKGGTYPDGSKQKSLAQSSVKQQVSVINGFYKSHDITIPTSIKPITASGKAGNIGIPEKEELEIALANANLTQKTVIYIGTSSGLAISDILKLSVGQVTKDIDENNITTLTLNRKKTDIPFETFLSPEATRTIRQYLNYRNGYGTSSKKHIQQDWHNKRKVNSDDDFLFVNEQISSKYLETLDDSIRALDENAFMKSVKSLSIKCGFNPEKNTYCKFHSHSFRKYFSTKLLSAGCNEIFKDYICGKKIDMSKKTYFFPTTAAAKKLYMTYLNEFTFENTQTITIKDDNYTALEKQIEEIEKVKDDNELLLRQEIDKVNSMYVDMSNMSKLVVTYKGILNGYKGRLDILEAERQVQQV